MNKLALALVTSLVTSLTACGGVVDDETLPPDDQQNEEPTGEQPTDVLPTDEEPLDELQVAPFDNDSLQQPAQDLFLSITGTRALTHGNEISVATGDADDWVAFRLPSNSNSQQRVWVTLDCALTGSPDAIVRATVWTNGAATTKAVACNVGERPITIDTTRPHAVRVHVASTPGAVHVDYTLTVRGF